jgi:putative hydrolase of the HAD superfamily
MCGARIATFNPAMTGITIIAFDADDTLWVNEPYFQEVEHKFCALLEDYMPAHAVSKELYRIEMKNLPLYGYGIKAFILCMMETVLEITNKTGSPELLYKAIQYGQEMMQKPIELRRSNS